MDSRTLCMLTIAATLGFVSTPGLARPVDGEGQRSSRRVRILERFDADGDGKLNGQERTAARESRRAKILEHFDTNGNGVIDLSEREAIGKARMERRGKRRERFLEQFDANGDGQLDEQERAAARRSSSTSTPTATACSTTTRRRQPGKPAGIIGNGRITRTASPARTPGPKHSRRTSGICNRVRCRA